MNNSVSAKEASEILNISIQKLYMLRDQMNSAKKPRKPIAQRGKDWDYIDGKAMFSKEYLERVKLWREESKSVKAKKLYINTESFEVMVIIKGVATNITGSRAKRISNIVDTYKKHLEEHNSVQTIVENTIRLSPEIQTTGDA